jgi:hypothetical protein
MIICHGIMSIYKKINHHKNRRFIMRKLNSRKLKRIHDILRSFDNENRNIVYNSDYILEYCLENDIQNCIKTTIGRFDDQLFYNIFNSLGLRIDIKEVNKKQSKKLIKYDLNYSDIETFSNNYNDKFK